MKTRKTVYNTRTKCLICSKDVISLEQHSRYPMYDIFNTLRDVLKFHSKSDWLDQELSQWKFRQPGNFGYELVHNGLIVPVSAGYGSNHDGDVYVMALCDECIVEKKEKGLLIFDHNSMWPEDDE